MWYYTDAKQSLKKSFFYFCIVESLKTHRHINGPLVYDPANPCLFLVGKLCLNSAHGPCECKEAHQAREDDQWLLQARQ